MPSGDGPSASGTATREGDPAEVHVPSSEHVSSGSCGLHRSQSADEDLSISLLVPGFYL